MKALAQIFQDAASLDAPLSQRLALFDQGLRDLGDPWVAANDEMVIRLASAHSGAAAPAIGDPFPEFVLPDDQGRLVSSLELLSTGPLVVSFNRGPWCEYCQLELRALQQISSHAVALGAQIVSITPERMASAVKCKSENGLTFPVLCDLDLGLAIDLGLAVPIGDQMAEMLRADGVPLSMLQGGQGWLLPIPATFVVAPDGLIAASFVEPDFRRRMEPADVVAALRAI